MLSQLFSGTTIPALEQVVNFSQARHAVLAGNIANFDTPGYRVRDLSPERFQTRLADALKQRDAEGPVSPGDLAAFPSRRLEHVSEDMEGLLFHDDVTLSDYEDASSFGLKTYREWGLPASVQDIRKSDDLIGRWTILKINALDEFAGELAQVVRDEQPAVRTARTNLGHTVIVAPQDGVVTRVDQLQLGAYLNASQVAFWLISGQPWVEANFKEDQLAKMRVGQPAEIKIDANGKQKLKGHVASFSPGTGSAFSALPAQNATGNWVKVVQRLPVEIAIDEVPQGLPLHMGLSVEVTVDTGHKRHIFGSDEQPAAAPASKGATR